MEDTYRISIFIVVTFEVAFKKIQVHFIQEYVVKLSTRIKLCEYSNFVIYFARENGLLIICNIHSLR